MKILLPLTIFIFALTSCSNSSNGTNTANITAGAYKLTEYNVGTIPVDLNNDGVFNTNLVNETYCYRDNFIMLQSGGTFTRTSPSPSFTNFSNGAVTSVTCTISNSTGTWSENSTSVFFISSNDGPFTLTKEGNNLRRIRTETVGNTSTVYNALYIKQ